MGSEVGGGARVSSSDGGDRVSGSKIDDFSSFGSQRGNSISSGSTSWVNKLDTGFHKSNYLRAKSEAIDTLNGLDHGLTNGCAFTSEGRQVQRKLCKASRNGSDPFRKLQTLQSDSLLPQAGNDAAKVELDTPGSQLVKCSYADKSQAAKQRNNLNGKRGDRRNPKVQIKSKFDPFSLKASFLSFSPAAGGSNAFGMYGLKPDVHDVTKLMDDISLEDLLHGTCKCPPLCKDKGKKTSNVNDNTLDSVRKAYSLIQLQGLQKGKQAEELDTHVNDKNSSLSPPSNIDAENGSDGSGNTAADSSKCNNDSELCMKAEASADVKDTPLYNPKDVLQRLVLPPPKDLESLLQDAVKPAASLKLSDSRSSKLLSHRTSLPPFPWSHSFNGHHKSSNDALKIANRSTCQGRWVRIRSTPSLIGGGTDAFLDVDSLTYDDSLVPAGRLTYRFPEIGSSSITSTGRHSPQSNSSAVPSTLLPTPESGRAPQYKLEALHSPRVLKAARILCDIASCPKHNFSGIVKWPKQPSQKAMKARKYGSNEKPAQEFLTPKSETMPDHAVRSVECGSSSKKPRITLVERREEFSHVQAVIGLSSVSAPRSNRSSPSRLSRDSVTEARHLNGSIAKSSFIVPAHPRVLDRSNHNPQKIRKVVPLDWNRTRS